MPLHRNTKYLFILWPWSQILKSYCCSLYQSHSFGNQVFILLLNFLDILFYPNHLGQQTIKSIPHVIEIALTFLLPAFQIMNICLEPCILIFEILDCLLIMIQFVEKPFVIFGEQLDLGLQFTDSSFELFNLIFERFHILSICQFSESFHFYLCLHFIFFPFCFVFIKIIHQLLVLFFQLLVSQVVFFYDFLQLCIHVHASVSHRTPSLQLVNIQNILNLLIIHCKCEMSNRLIQILKKFLKIILHHRKGFDNIDCTPDQSLAIFEVLIFIDDIEFRDSLCKFFCRYFFLFPVFFDSGEQLMSWVRDACLGME